MSVRTRRPVPPCFAPILEPLLVPGHWNVKGTDHWVARHFDQFAVVSPTGDIVEVLSTLDDAGRVAVEYRPEPAVGSPVPDAVTERVSDLLDQALDAVTQAAYEGSHVRRQEPAPTVGSPWSTPDLPAEHIATLAEVRRLLRTIKTT